MESGRNDVLSFASSTDGKISASTRLQVVLRDISWTEFSLELMAGTDSQFNESVFLENTVFKACKAIKDSQLDISHPAAAQDIPSDTNSPSKKKK